MSIYKRRNVIGCKIHGVIMELNGSTNNDTSTNEAYFFGKADIFRWEYGWDYEYNKCTGTFCLENTTGHYRMGCIVNGRGILRDRLQIVGKI